MYVIYPYYVPQVFVYDIDDMSDVPPSPSSQNSSVYYNLPSPLLPDSQVYYAVIIIRNLSILTVSICR